MKIDGKIVPFRKFGLGVLDTVPELFTGIKEMRHLGYGNLQNTTISSDTATPFHVLLVESEVQTK